jgi:hypothetical protein
MRLNQNVDHVAVLIHSTPQILLSPIDSNKDLVQMPVLRKDKIHDMLHGTLLSVNIRGPQAASV